MKLVIDIPDEYYKSDFLRNDDRFNDFFSRVAADIDYHGCCGKYEKEIAHMFRNVFNNATILSDDIKYEDCRDLYKTIAEFIIPRLKYLRDHVNSSYPENTEIKSSDEWISYLDDMIHSFELIAIIDDYTGESLKNNIEDISKGLYLFSKWYMYLWI